MNPVSTMKSYIEKPDLLHGVYKKSLWSNDNSLLSTNASEVSKVKHTYNNTQQENCYDLCSIVLKEAMRTKLAKEFRIKIPYFPKKPFGKHESLNNSELNFIETDIKNKQHNLYEKKTKFYKIVCGRSTSVSRKRERKSFRSPTHSINNCKQ